MIKKVSKKHDKIVKEAYNLLVQYRKNLEEKGDFELANQVEETSHQLWCECLNERAPWLSPKH